jgi:hypothetical protein
MVWTSFAEKKRKQKKKSVVYHDDLRGALTFGLKVK